MSKDAEDHPTSMPGTASMERVPDPFVRKDGKFITNTHKLRRFAEHLIYVATDIEREAERNKLREHPFGAEPVERSLTIEIFGTVVQCRCHSGDGDP